MDRTTNRMWGLFLAAWGSTLLGSAAHAASVDEFYKGKTIEFIVATEAATVYDVWARLLAKYMPRYIPGNPNFAVKNMPGGGHIVATNYLFNTAAQDGTAIGTFSRNIPTSAILGKGAIKFDVTKFQWLGSTDMPSRICVAKAGAAVQKGEDLFNSELIVGGNGPGNSVSTTPNLLAGLLGMKFKVVEGYKGAPEVFLAIERGEVHGICQTLTGIENERPDWIKSGRLKVLFNMEKNPIPGIDAPTIYKFIKSAEHAQIVAFYNSNVELGRPFAAPPGVPADRFAALRKAFDLALKDADLMADVAKTRIEMVPMTGEDLKDRIDSLANTAPEIIAKTKAIVGDGGL